MDKIEKVNNNLKHYYFLTYVLNEKSVIIQEKILQHTIIKNIKKNDENAKIMLFKVVNKEDSKHYNNIHYHILVFSNKVFNNKDFYVKNFNIKQYNFKSKFDYPIDKRSPEVAIGYIIDKHLVLEAFNNFKYDFFIKPNYKKVQHPSFYINLGLLKNDDKKNQDRINKIRETNPNYKLYEDEPTSQKKVDYAKMYINMNIQQMDTFIRNVQINTMEMNILVKNVKIEEKIEEKVVVKQLKKTHTTKIKGLSGVYSITKQNYKYVAIKCNVF